MVKEFNGEEIHNDKYLSTKMIFFRDKTRISFHDDRLPPKKVPCVIH